MYMLQVVIEGALKGFLVNKERIVLACTPGHIVFKKKMLRMSQNPHVKISKNHMFQLFDMWIHTSCAINM